MNSVEFRQLCQMIKALEVSLNGKIDGFSRQFMGALKGIASLDTSVVDKANSIILKSLKTK